MLRLTTTAVAIVFGLQVAMPASALADKKKDAAIGAVIGVAVGVAIASKLKNKMYRESRWSAPFSPKAGVVCYPDIRECYKRGQFSPGWTNGEFGYY